MSKSSKSHRERLQKEGQEMIVHLELVADVLEYNGRSDGIRQVVLNASAMIKSLLEEL